MCGWYDLFGNLLLNFTKKLTSYKCAGTLALCHKCQSEFQSIQIHCVHQSWLTCHDRKESHRFNNQMTLENTCFLFVSLFIYFLFQTRHYKCLEFNACSNVNKYNSVIFYQAHVLPMKHLAIQPEHDEDSDKTPLYRFNCIHIRHVHIVTA